MYMWQTVLGKLFLKIYNANHIINKEITNLTMTSYLMEYGRNIHYDENTIFQYSYLFYVRKGSVDENHFNDLLDILIKAKRKM